MVSGCESSSHGMPSDFYKMYYTLSESTYYAGINTYFVWFYFLLYKKNMYLYLRYAPMCRFFFFNPIRIKRERIFTYNFIKLVLQHVPKRNMRNIKLIFLFSRAPAIPIRYEMECR